MNEIERRSLTDAVKSEARRIGFQWVGVTSPDPPGGYPVYERWLAAGRHGEMYYLASDHGRRRSDPRLILPECRSILVLGMQHPAPEASEPTTSPGPHGRVASYAFGADYHAVIPERLRNLVAFIEAQIGHPVPNRWYTDTGPILERDLAQRAGLGWIGKNTCLLHPRMGSYYLLAEVLLGVDLESDPPFHADHCGSCTRCLEACPTKCILPDRTLDARRCISYLTIELKGPIPRDLRAQMGDWIFGCDVCQEVCPWNQRFATPEGEPALAARPSVPRPSLREEIYLSPQDFNSKFRGSPVKRARRRGYLRNVAVALGNSGDRSAIPALTDVLLHEPEPLVRQHAAWALGRIGEREAVQALQRALQTERLEDVRSEIQLALDSLAPSGDSEQSDNRRSQ